MKKKLFVLVLVLSLLLMTTSTVLADKPVQTDANGNEIAWENTTCASIPDGTILDSAGNPITTGYDIYGYNYQAHMFNGTYDSVDRVLDDKYWGATGDYVDDKLMMKWSDSWLANVDCNNDHKLDRGLVNGVVGGASLGWETNHIEGEYIDTDANLQHYTYFAKIVWVGEGGDLWGSFHTIMENYQDPTGMSHFHEAAPGFGLNDQWTTQ